MLENTEGAIKKGQSRETGNIRLTRRRKPKQKDKRICIQHLLCSEAYLRICIILTHINVRECRKGQSKMDNTENAQNLAT